MRRHRHLLTLLLVAVYAVVSTFGMAFVICVEGNGRQHLEILGAPCCPSAGSTAAAADGTQRTTSGPTGGDCGDCEVHLAAVALDATKLENAQPDTSSPVLPPPPALLTASARPCLGLARSRGRLRLRPPRAPPGIDCIRSVVFLC